VPHYILLDYPYLTLVHGKSPIMCIYTTYVQNERYNIVAHGNSSRMPPLSQAATTTMGLSSLLQVGSPTASPLPLALQRFLYTSLNRQRPAVPLDPAPLVG
jgi:hypothetical protein